MEVKRKSQQKHKKAEENSNIQNAEKRKIQGK